MDRREFIQMLSVAAASAGGGGCAWAPLSAGGGAAAGATEAADRALYDLPPFGEARILHTCDIHAQLLPGYFREPNVNLGFGALRGVPPHVVGDALLKQYGIAPHSRLAYALSHINFSELAARYGATGGAAPLATLLRQLRESAGGARASLHLDSGDLWHGSFTALKTQGADMVQAANILGIDAQVGHWEFTYPEEVVRQNIARFNGEFLSQNIFVKEEALFEGAPAYDEDSGLAFKPVMLREIGGRRVAVIGQSFPFTPIANPQRFVPHWTFGIRAQELQGVIDAVRQREAPDAVILLSHNGADLDAALAADVRGLDFILGGHTHDNLYRPRVINGTAVVNSGCAGKFVGCLDIAFNRGGGVRDFRWRMLPVFANLLPGAADMQAHIDKTRAPYESLLGERLATTSGWLYRRGNFNGTMDQLIVNALRQSSGSDIALSPGFRWGASVPAGAITMEDVYNATAITYPQTYARDMRGADIKNILESVADNLYHQNPYYQQGGDMVRTGGLRYTLQPREALGRRISDLRLSTTGAPLQADKHYRVAGWATQTPSDGPPIWQVLAEYLRAEKTVSVELNELPKIAGGKNNPGIADYPAALLSE